MFGSKIRSWMENHIKKKRTNKKNSSNNLSTTNNTHNGHKGMVSIIQNDNSNITSTTAATTATSSGPTTSSAITTNSISSPARRSEVSPIQNHTTSRFGWQSPKHENAMSPKSDHFMYMHSVKAHTLSSSSSLSTNQSGILPSGTSSSSTNSSSLIKKKTKTLSPNIMLRKSSSKLSSTQDTNYINISNQKIQQQQQSTNIKMNNPYNNHNIQQHQHQSHVHSSQCNQSCANQTYKTNDNSMKCLINNNNGIGTNKQCHYDIHVQNNNKNQNLTIKKQGTSSQQNLQHQKIYQNYDKIQQKKTSQQQQHQQNDENRYGKILPSKKSSFEQFKSSIDSYDNLNANVHQFKYNPDEFDETAMISNNNNNNSNNNNNNNNSSSSSISGQKNSSKSTNCINNVQSYNIHQQLHHHLHHSGGQIQLRNGNEQNRNIIRTNRYNNNSMVGGGGTQPNNHPLAHVINSLSSPESAYSTGYSTDGTSPGATYAPPEYYINIRTGTHYFPKTVNTLAIETNRYKFGLNKIEEMSPQEPLPNNNNNNHRRTESFDLTQNKIPGFGIPDPAFLKTKTLQSQGNQTIQQQNIVLQNFKGFESPSPRQRCRIRTNPWYSTAEASSTGNSIFLTKKIEIDASSSSSGIKSSSDAGISDKNEKNEKTSESDTTSSSTEVDIQQRTFSPSTIRRKKIISEVSTKSEIHVTHSLHQQDSDEDATLNEMMGKFDESYVYEKETDILSDSDPTDCPSDLDTGQDAGDECDTDELLDIDFIDTGSIQEIIEKDSYKNSGSCSYFNYQLERRTSRKRRSRKQNEDLNNSKRKKRLLKTRKKSIENKDRCNSPIHYNRESRSLGGTPVSLRRNQSADNKKTPKISPLTNRSSSLTFTEVHAIRGRFIAIAESEKALLKADLEADVKYKQLIHEAETILVSMKTGNTALRETTNISNSPRRICNPPANKRVEILRNCEADIKREIAKQTSKSIDSSSSLNGDNINPPSVINKRLEMIKYETNSAPNSPKCGRFSPRKTHITNFINQNVPSSTPPPLCELTPTRKNSLSDIGHQKISSSSQVQFNNSHNYSLRSQSNSPSIRRRVRSQSPRIRIDSDSDTDDDQSKRSSIASPTTASSTLRRIQYQKFDSSENPITDNHNNKNNEFNDVISMKVRQKIRDLKDDLSNKNVVLALEKMSLYDELDYTNRNYIDTKKPSLISFRSIDMGNRNSINISYCPQSEPLKRKIYRGSSSFERLKKSLDLESEIPKQALLDKISNLRKERQAMKGSNPEMNRTSMANSQELMMMMIKNNNGHDDDVDDNDDSIAAAATTTTTTGLSSRITTGSTTQIMINTTKHQLILNTIEDLKRSLEDQSVELCGLNDDTSN